MHEKLIGHDHSQMRCCAQDEDHRPGSPLDPLWLRSRWPTMTPHGSARVLNIKAGNELDSMLQCAICARAKAQGARTFHRIWPICSVQDLSSMLTRDTSRAAQGENLPAFAGLCGLELSLPGPPVSVPALSNAGVHSAQYWLVHSLPAVLHQWPPCSTVAHRKGASREVLHACLGCFTSPR